MTTHTTLRIAIIGGGPGGLTLARILQTRNIPTTVFERDSHPDERLQGGTLDLHPASGQLALHLAGLDEQFRAIARYEDQGIRILSKAGQVLFEHEGGEEPGDRPEVDRAELRTMLLDSLAPGVVRWGHTLRSVRQADDGTYELLFEHGLSETFDLVVGADGAWSRVRPLLSSAMPSYTGVTFIEFGLDEVDQQHPALARLVGHGMLSVQADSVGMVAQRNGHGHIRVYATLRVPERWATTNGFDASDPHTARTWLLDLFRGWDQRLLALIQESNDRFAVRPMYMLPVGHAWAFRPGVTLLGDAAHLMAPFGGEGVNQAMLDAADLARTVGESSNLEDAVRTYEQTMFVRAKRVAEEVAEGMHRAYASDTTGDSILAFFQEVMSADHE